MEEAWSPGRASTEQNNNEVTTPVNFWAPCHAHSVVRSPQEQVFRRRRRCARDVPPCTQRTRRPSTRDRWTPRKKIHHDHLGSSEWSGTRPRAEYNFRMSHSTSLELSRVPRCLELGVLTPVGRTESLVVCSNEGTFTKDVCDDTPGWHCFVDDGSPQRHAVFSFWVTEVGAIETRDGQMACRSVCASVWRSVSGVSGTCVLYVLCEMCAMCVTCAMYVLGRVCAGAQRAIVSLEVGEWCGARSADVFFFSTRQINFAFRSVRW